MDVVQPIVYCKSLMKNFPNFKKAAALALGLFASTSGFAQISIPLTNINLTNSSLPAVSLSLNGSTGSGIPTPFTINQSWLISLTWFCLDPRQTIYYSGNQPSGGASSLEFKSWNPADFDLWGAGAPGLSTSRLQNLADLFQAYLPTSHIGNNLGAIQIAVWEIANESNSNASPFNLSSGYFTAASGDAAMIATASNMLSSLTTAAVQGKGTVDGPSGGGIISLIDGKYYTNASDRSSKVDVQDLIGYVTPIPEPSTYGMFGVGLLFAIIGFRRFRARAKVVQA